MPSSHAVCAERRALKRCQWERRPAIELATIYLRGANHFVLRGKALWQMRYREGDGDSARPGLWDGTSLGFLKARPSRLQRRPSNVCG